MRRRRSRLTPHHIVHWKKKASSLACPRCSGDLASLLHLQLCNFAHHEMNLYNTSLLALALCPLFFRISPSRAVLGALFKMSQQEPTPATVASTAVAPPPSAPPAVESSPLREHAERGEAHSQHQYGVRLWNGSDGRKDEVEVCGQLA